MGALDGPSAISICVTPDEIRAAVWSAFSPVRRPPEAQIALHQCDECADLRATFRDLNWAKVPAATLEENFGKLPLFSPMAYAYFLPAWLLYAIDHPSTDAIVTEFLVYDLAPTGGEEEWHRERLRALTPAQVAACDAVLALLTAQPGFVESFYDYGIAAGRARYRESWEHRWDG